MKKALFIHGYLGDGDSKTGICVKEALKDEYDFICPNFDLTDVNGTLAKINEILKNENIELLSGTSLGSFYVLAADFSGQKLIVNPCMKPSEEIPLLHSDRKIPEEILTLWKTVENQIFNEKNTQKIQGFFANSDELFGDKYIPLFEHCFGKEYYRFDGGHHGYNPNLTEAVKKYFKVL